MGRPLASGAHTIGEPWRFSLHTADGHGNARAAGGEAVTVDVAGPAGSGVRAAVVTDCGNGCYAVAFEPDCAGRWLLTPRHDCCLSSLNQFRPHSVKYHLAYVSSPHIA